MWKRILPPQIKLLASAAGSRAAPLCGHAVAESSYLSLSTRASSISASSSILVRQTSSASADTAVRKRIEDVMPIATGHEKEELDAELEGRELLDINFPTGPFGTKEVPAVVKSYYDKRIIGCPGGEGEDEHDVVWFWLEKGKPFECPVCSQYFELRVVGPGGPPDGHGDDNHHH
ncbi:PREDICTED: cytochrome c oxidase subunit 5b-2, mitochondrial [Tarenaya hassleriana]|uniref:cytochrome c oxidase subunit 5b-2, mitochondrial n=1 Tax=Tarenaya hassleriana TaxID=28532 RepID=UPI00053C2288|nr:PREDICTED: cytochrome c oxidase subunit 5b-2, mitochondrial [Tarenaya hassleriana]